MAEEINPVEDVERVEIPAAGGEDVQPEGVEAPAEGAAAPEEGGEPEGRRETLVPRQPKEPDGKDENEGAEGQGDDKTTPKPVEGETPRERALRIKLNELQQENKRRFGGELKLGDGAPVAEKKELSPERAKVLEKYKPEEINSLKEVLPVLAEQMGFVRADQLSSQQYAEQSQSILDEFLEKHAEYLPENDKDGVLWERFKQEFSMYRQPQNPKDYRKLFNKVHSEVFGIKPSGDRGAVDAAQRKIQVASHAGNSGPSRPTVSERPRAGAGLRTDMLKGFSEEELSEMVGEG